MKTEVVVPRTLQAQLNKLALSADTGVLTSPGLLSDLAIKPSIIYYIYMISIWLFTLYYKQINVKYSFEFRIIRSDKAKSDKSTTNVRTPMAALNASLLNLWSLGVNACGRCELIEL